MNDKMIGVDMAKAGDDRTAYGVSRLRPAYDALALWKSFDEAVLRFARAALERRRNLDRFGHEDKGKAPGVRDG